MPTAAPGATPPPVRYRLLYAYAVTGRLLASYLAVEIAGWVLGRQWREAALLRCHRRSARRAERAILRLRGLFIKVGQLLSMMTSFLPGEFREQLEGLQDQIPPRPLAEVTARLRAELGGSPEELFAAFDPQPIAAASLAQVHEARLADGRRVAVKIQHVGIEATARRDLDTMRRILGVVALFVRIRGLAGIHTQLRAMIEEELDFGREAANIAEIAAAFAADSASKSHVVFPEVVPERSTPRVLTTTYIDGVKVSRRDALDAAGLDRQRVAEELLVAYCTMIVEHGVYHADPHPGNLFVLPHGAIAFVDFGAVGRLTDGMREGIPELLAAVLGHDPARVLGALRRMGFVTRTGDERAAERVVDYLLRRFLEQVTLESWNLQNLAVDARMKLEVLADLRRLNVSLRDLIEIFEVPRDWILLERTLLLLVGLCAHLAPAMNPMTTVRPYLERLVLGGDRDWLSVGATAAKDLALATIALPGDLRRLVARAERGELEVQSPGLEHSLERIAAAVHQLLYGLFAVGGGLIAYLANSRQEARIAMFAAAVGTGAVLLVIASFWRSRRGRR
jgi:predicted unusual protein kinase regulating ubiquinone biosynthesis (AarF/ABC1/UbiB family)